MSVQEYTHICFDEECHCNGAKNEDTTAYKKPDKSEPSPIQSVAALEVLIGLVGGLVCDHKLEDKEIHYLKDWLKKNISRNDTYPFNYYISNIKAILKDQIVSADEHEQLLRFLRHQAKFEDQIYIPCKYIEGIKKAFNLALNGESKACLKILNGKELSEAKDQVTCWMRATLYKMMGDEPLSRHHYRRTNVKYEQHINAQDELKFIIERLGFDYSAILNMAVPSPKS